MIVLDNELCSQMKGEAEKAYPNECCGFILGKMEGDIKSADVILPCDNSSEESEQFHRFIITPEQMMSAELDARKRKLDIIGFYHSHPDCPAVPSEFDRSHALPVYSYVIVSVLKGAAADLRCWELDPDKDYTVFRSESIDIKGEE